MPKFESGFTSDKAMADFFERFESSVGPHPWGKRFVGRDAIKKALSGGPASTARPHRTERGPRYVFGNHGMYEWVSSTTTEDGQPVQMYGVDLVEFRDGLVCRKVAYRKSTVPGHKPIPEPD